MTVSTFYARLPSGRRVAVEGGRLEAAPEVMDELARLERLAEELGGYAIRPTPTSPGVPVGELLERLEGAVALLVRMGAVLEGSGAPPPELVAIFAVPEGAEALPVPLDTR